MIDFVKEIATGNIKEDIKKLRCPSLERVIEDALEGTDLSYHEQYCLIEGVLDEFNDNPKGFFIALKRELESIKEKAEENGIDADTGLAIEPKEEPKTYVPFGDRWVELE